MGDMMQQKIRAQSGGPTKVDSHVDPNNMGLPGLLVLTTLIYFFLFFTN